MAEDEAQAYSEEQLQELFHPQWLNPPYPGHHVRRRWKATLAERDKRIAELEARVKSAEEACTKQTQALASDLRYERERLRLADQANANLRKRLERAASGSSPT